MNHRAILIVVTTLSAAVISTPSLAVQTGQAEENRIARGECETLLREDYAGFDISFGDCLSDYMVPRDPNNGGYAATTCRFYLETGQLTGEGYSSYTSCVRLFPDREF